MKLLPYLLALGFLSACRAAENSGALAEYREYFEIADMLGGPSAGTFCSLATPEQMLERDNTRKRLAANPDLLLKVHGWHDQNGRRQGEWHEWRFRKWLGGGWTLLYEGSYVDDKRIGLWTASARKGTDDALSIMWQDLHKENGSVERLRGRVNTR